MREVLANQANNSPLLEEALRCQRNRRKQSKRMHKKTKMLTEVYKSQRVVVPKSFNLSTILKNCYLPEALSDWLTTKRTTGINSINSLLTLAAKAMTQQLVPLSEISNYSLRQEVITQELLFVGELTPQRRAGGNRSQKTKIEKTVETNYQQPIMDYIRMDDFNEQLLNMPLNLANSHLDESEQFLRMI